MAPRRAAATAASAATSAAYAQTSAWTKGTGGSTSTPADAGASSTHTNGHGGEGQAVGSARDTPQTEGSEDPFQLPFLPPDDAEDDDDYTQPKATAGRRSTGRSSMRTQHAPLPAHTPRIASARTSAVAARSSLGSAGKGKAASASSPKVVESSGAATPTTLGKKGAGALPILPPAAPPSPIVVRLRQMWKFAALSQFLFTFDEAFGMKGFETEVSDTRLLSAVRITDQESFATRPSRTTLMDRSSSSFRSSCARCCTL